MPGELLLRTPGAVFEHCSVAFERTDDDNEWLEQRRVNGIGASEVPALLGLSQTSAIEILAAKRGVLPDSFKRDTEQMRWGRRLEPQVLEEFSRFHVSSGWVSPNSFSFLSNKYPLYATPDGWSSDALESFFLSLELKCTGRGWLYADGVPPHVMIQVQSQLAVTGAERGVLVVFEGLKIRTREIARDERMIGEIVSVVERFWNIVKYEEPLIEDAWIRGTSEERRALNMLVKESASESKPTIKLPGERAIALLDEIERMKAVKARADERQRIAEAKLLSMTGGSSIAELDDKRTLTVTSVTMPPKQMGEYTYTRLSVRKPRRKE